MHYIYSSSPVGEHHLQLVFKITNMKLVILALLVVMVTSAPQRPRKDYRHVKIVSDTREDHGDGRFRYHFVTDHGVDVHAQGTPGRAGQSNIQGGFRFPFPEGGVGEFTYVADELGYRPQSPLIPTPHPLPAHAIEQIRFAEQERRRTG